MGANYYLFEKDPCSACGRSYEPLHIGKSSAGWCFALHVIPDEGINGLEDWKARWANPGAVIEDEYGDTVSPEEMLSLICDRKRPYVQSVPYGYRSWAHFHLSNHSENGPNGLLRARDTANEGGTWDLIEGDFS